MNLIDVSITKDVSTFQFLREECCEMSSGQIVDMTNVVVNLPIGLSRFKVKVKLWNV
jgi:hypothetical protein